MVNFNTQRGAFSRLISRTDELKRIAALPKFDIEVLAKQARPTIDEYIQPKGTMELRPSQEQALVAAFFVGGTMGALRVGAGKTLVASLIPSLFPDCRALILAKAALVRQGERMMQEYSYHFSISDSVRWMSYDFLSRANGTDILDRLKPDIIIADESQCLSRFESARTKRFMRFMDDNPQTMFVFLSGTIMRRSIKDFAHLSSLAMGEGSPLPRDWNTVNEWAECLDEGEGNRYPGALSMLYPDRTAVESVEDGRRTIQDRLRDTLGVVIGKGEDCQASLTIKPFRVRPSETIKKYIKNLDATWTRPDGEELVLALDVWRVRSQLFMGGFYKWAVNPPAEWLQARGAWNIALRKFLTRHSKAHLDSPFLVIKAIKDENVSLLGKHLEPLKKLYVAWKVEEGKFATPNVVWQWIDGGHLMHLATELRKKAPCIVWSNHLVPSHELAGLMGVPYYGAKEGDSIHSETGKRSIVASIKAHGTGRNLQKAFSRNVVIGVPDDWEQLIGRTHRSGQEADEVEVYVSTHLKEDLERGIKDAEYQQITTDQPRKIVYADKEEWPEGW